MHGRTGTSFAKRESRHEGKQSFLTMEKLAAPARTRDEITRHGRRL